MSLVYGITLPQLQSTHSHDSYSVQFTADDAYMHNISLLRIMHARWRMLGWKVLCKVPCN